jgi:hypothetical protein
MPSFLQMDQFVRGQAQVSPRSPLRVVYPALQGLPRTLDLLSG